MKKGIEKNRRNQEDRTDVVPEIEALLEGVNIKNNLRKRERERERGKADQ